jgi:transcriptional regulator with XRE-family HTH domain
MENYSKMLIALGSRIRLLRQKKGWTQEQLGEYADINYKYLGELERGRQNPSFHFLIKIADALDIKLHELTRIEEDSLDRDQVLSRLNDKIMALSEADAKNLLSILNILYPLKK